MSSLAWAKKVADHVLLLLGLLLLTAGVTVGGVLLYRSASFWAFSSAWSACWCSARAPPGCGAAQTTRQAGHGASWRRSTPMSPSREARRARWRGCPF